MLSGTDDEAFDSIMRDLALAFPPTVHDVERVRVYWGALKHVPIHDVKRLALAWQKVGKKFPAPSNLMPEKSAAPSKHTSIEDPDVVARAERLSHWARAANQILHHVAYCDRRRGLVPLGEDLLARCLRAKRDLVDGAEQDDHAGQPWDEREFNIACRQAFEKVLGLTDMPVPDPEADVREALRAAVAAQQGAAA